MKKLKIIMRFCLFIAFPVTIYAQQPGVQFEKKLSFQEATAKAKFEHKYIFIDCYASWCGPCKMMDQRTYNDSNVGKFVNSNFIAVKFQLDTSKNDPNEIRNSYADAEQIKKDFKIISYPTFLFLSPEGILVHKGIGFLDTTKFIKLCSNAMDPQKQYYTLLHNYENGHKDYSTMAYLSNEAQLLGDVEKSKIIAKDYIDNSLIHLNKINLYTPENLYIISNGLFNGTINCQDEAFDLFYGQEKLVDSITNRPGLAETTIRFAIEKEFIFPALWNEKIEAVTDNPDWNGMRMYLSSKFKQGYVDYTLIDSKMRWYNWKKNWQEYIVNVMTLMENFRASMDDFNTEEYAWRVFLYSTNKEQLREANSWISEIVHKKPDAAVVDTYANILYKLGKKSEALEWEAKALKTAQGGDVKPIQNNFDKMRQGQPTWPGSK